MHIRPLDYTQSPWCPDSEFVLSIKPTTSGGTRTHNPRLRRPVPYPLGHRGLPELHRVMVVVISIEKMWKILALEKFRGHPGLNQGPLDLQSNALPLSYIPLRKKLNSAWVYSSITLAREVRFLQLRTWKRCPSQHRRSITSCAQLPIDNTGCALIIASNNNKYKQSAHILLVNSPSTPSRDRIVVSTLRCRRNNPGSTPGHGILIS